VVPLCSQMLCTTSKFVEDTIYALSSGPLLKTGVAVIRVSGPNSKYCLNSLLENKSKFPIPRHASLRRLVCPMTSEILDHALVLWLPGPKSYTGEDIVELHVHGSKAVVDGIFSSFEHFDREVQSNGCSRIRHADKGEFTKRAYYTGKMDLTEIEGVGDLLFADTSSQRKQALRQMEGHMRRTYESWRYRALCSMHHCRSAHVSMTETS
jgi:tRNA U34 5-carboxymethylaminomethyl modifying GTPase MnmE/TrmE